MHVAIGQHQRTDSVGNLYGDELRDSPAAIVADEVELNKVELV